MFRLMIVLFFFCTTTADIFYKWNEHSVYVKIFGEHVINDHLLDHWHVLSDRYSDSAKLLTYSYPEDILQVSQLTIFLIPRFVCFNLIFHPIPGGRNVQGDVYKNQDLRNL